MIQQFFGLLMTQTWQITALAIIVAVVVKLAAKNRPHLAHALWVLVLIKCVTPPLWEHSLGVFSQLQAQLIPVDSPSLLDGSDSPASVPVAMAETLVPALEIDVPDSEHGQHETYEPDELLSLADTEPPEAASLMWESGTGIELDEAAQTFDRQEANIANAEPELPVESVESDAGWLRNGWLLLSGLVAGAMVTFFIMIIRCLRCLREIHRDRTTEFDDLLRERVQQLSRQLRIRRTPQIIVSDVLFGPAVLGLLRHTIVLPRCLFEKMERRVFDVVPSPPKSGEKVADRPDEGSDRESSRFNIPLSYLDPILAHELLHIRRGDLRTGTLQAIAQSLWWFHPAVWFSNRWLSREAERCCDEQVIAELGCSPAQYARSLLSVIECKHQLQPIPVFPGMKPVEITTQRMERIMSLKNGLKKRTPLWCWLTVAGLAFVVLPGAVAKLSPDEAAAIVKQASGLPITPPTASASKQLDSKTTDGKISSPAAPNEIIADERIQPTEMARPVPEFVLKSTDALVKLGWDAREASQQRLLMTDQPLSLATYHVADLVFRHQSVVSAVIRSTDSAVDATHDVVLAAALNSGTAVTPDQIVDASDTSGQEKALTWKADLMPLVELIKASVDPDSWQERGTVAVEEATLSLIIRQSEKAHEEIQELLSQLRDAQDQSVQIPCLVVHLTKESQMKWLEEQCSLHSLEHGSRWALLPQQRCESFTQALLEQKPEVLSRPRVITISGQTAMITVGRAAVGGTPAVGIRLEVTPHALPYSNVIRLHHSFAVGEFATEMPQSVESLVGSGQTLLLLIDDSEDKEKPDAAGSQYLLMMTPELIPQKEEEEDVSVATPVDSAVSVDPTESRDK